MNRESGGAHTKGLRVMAVGLTVLAIAFVWSGLIFEQRRGLFITLLGVSLGLVLLGAVMSFSASSASEPAGPARRLLQASVPVVVVAVAAVLATALYWTASLRLAQIVVDDPSIDWGAASETDLRIASIFGVVSEAGVTAALDRLEELASEDEEIRARGHGIAHAVGRYAIQNNGYDPSVFGDCREIFQSGCYHGVLEAFFEGKPDVDATTVAELCGSMIAADRPPIEAVECAHGLGHGLTVRFDFDLGAALERCEYLELEPARQECFDGVFMENAVHGMQPRMPETGHMHGASAASGETPANSDHHDRYRGMFRPEDAQYPCDEFGDRYQRACWAYQYMIVLRLNGDDLGAAFESCDEAPGEGTSACYLGLGKRIGWQHEESDDRLIAACERGSPEHLDDCLRGAMEYFMDTEFDANRALQLCGATPRDSREPCFRALGTRLGLVTVDVDEIERVCGGARDLASACLAGAATDAS